jgi:N-acetylmuramoyl-L-alanine amidase
MSRSADVHLCKDKFSKKEDLVTRIEMINSSNADLFISIHTNSFTNPKYFGAQVFYNGINPNNLLIASNVQSYLSAFTKTTRVHKNLDNIMILRNINKAGCLIETGFISNPNEYELYQSDDYLIKLANCIMYGIDDYFRVI